jgi:predicted GIY-YIG superfamily endonuclease
MPRAAVYRMYNADDDLLYVGATYSIFTRFHQHRYGSRWWEDVRRIEIEHCASIEEALAREVDAIRTEAPIFNRSPGSIRIAEKYWAKRALEEV